MESLIDKIIADKTLLGIVIALTGLLGVVLGSLLTAAKEWLFQRAKTQKEAEYLAIRVVFMLDRFLRECVDVAYDNGRSGSYYPIDERAVVQTTPPSFDPEKVQFDWKAIPASLTYEILNSTNLVSYAENRVSDFFENDSPPDYCEGFTERKFQYAKLGLKAAELAARLRKKMALPERDVADWDPLEHLVKVKMKIESDRKERDNRHAESIGSIRLHGANSTGDLPRPTLEEMST